MLSYHRLHSSNGNKKPSIPITMFTGPTWGPSGTERTRLRPMLAPWTLLSGRWPNMMVQPPKTSNHKRYETMSHTSDLTMIMRCYTCYQHNYHSHYHYYIKFNGHHICWGHYWCHYHYLYWVWYLLSLLSLLSKSRSSSSLPSWLNIMFSDWAQVALVTTAGDIISVPCRV